MNRIKGFYYFDFNNDVKAFFRLRLFVLIAASPKVNLYKKYDGNVMFVSFCTVTFCWIEKSQRYPYFFSVQS